MHIRRSRLVLVAAVAAATTISFAGQALAHDGNRKGGGGNGTFDIQAAVDAAEHGDTIRIPSGVYHQNVTITTDRISLRGHGVVLTPPADPQPTLCDDGNEERVSGICIFGAEDTVRGVSIRGITVEGFTGDGLIAVGTENLEVRDSKFKDNGGYGAASFVTHRTTFRSNVAVGNDEAGFYVGDSPDSRAEVRDNYSAGNELGLFFRNASNGKARGNVAEGNCIGVLILADAPGPATDWKIRDNKVNANNRVCPPIPEEEIPPLSGAGIVLAGAQGIEVRDNTVRDNASAADSAFKGGIVAAEGLGGTQPSGTVEDNKVRGNQPFDLVGAGTVVFDDNRCDTSAPAGLCEGRG